jgi:hypothetical protein
VVAGNGGYYNLSKLKLTVAGAKPVPGQHAESDGQGGTVSLNQYNETDWGFLRITVNAASILVEALTVQQTVTTTTPPPPIPPPTVIDSFTVNLAAHTVTTNAS